MCVYSIERNLGNVRNIVRRATHDSKELERYTRENQVILKAVGKTIRFYGWDVDIFGLLLTVAGVFCSATMLTILTAVSALHASICRDDE